VAVDNLGREIAPGTPVGITSASDADPVTGVQYVTIRLPLGPLHEARRLTPGTNYQSTIGGEQVDTLRRILLGMRMSASSDPEIQGMLGWADVMRRVLNEVAKQVNGR